MFCLWNLCWSQPTPQKPLVISDPKVVNPLYLEELPTTEIELKAFEGALIQNLISIHYKIEEIKKKVANEFRNGKTDQARALIAKKSHLLERKMFFEKRLEKVQKNLAALR